MILWIDFFNGHECAQAGRLAQAINDSEPIAVAGIVLTEILLGLRHDSEAYRIAALLEAFEEVREPSRHDYIEAASIYRLCRSRGITIRSTIDCLIAQLCIRDGLPLLGKDRHFEAIAKHMPLQLLAC